MATGRMNHYQVLMLDPGVDMDLMKTVYRRLVQRYQSASAGEDPARGRLQAVEQAYEVLRDPFRRARYDVELARHAQQDQPDEPAEAPVAPVVVPVVGERASTTRPIAVNALDFGRYAGWSLRQLAAHDPDYLEWLLRSPGGRQYRAEIMALLQPR